MDEYVPFQMPIRARIAEQLKRHSSGLSTNDLCKLLPDVKPKTLRSMVSKMHSYGQGVGKIGKRKPTEGQWWIWAG